MHICMADPSTFLHDPTQNRASQHREINFVANFAARANSGVVKQCGFTSKFDFRGPSWTPTAEGWLWTCFSCYSFNDPIQNKIFGLSSFSSMKPIFHSQIVSASVDDFIVRNHVPKPRVLLQLYGFLIDVTVPLEEGWMKIFQDGLEGV